MHPEDIKAAIRKSGSTSAEIAYALGVSRTVVSYIIHGRSNSARIARRICEVTGLTAEQLWPGRYPQLATEQHPKRRAA